MKESNIIKKLSKQRLSKYMNFSGDDTNDQGNTLSLYLLNVQISSAFLFPLHLCEVLSRNAISDALIKQYGVDWPWSNGFYISLPKDQKNHLNEAKKGFSKGETGRVIANSKFIFWQNMLTSRFDSRLWCNKSNSISDSFPNSNLVSNEKIRESLYADMKHIRILRNRIAHYEPLIERNLSEDLTVIRRIISFRCKDTLEWVDDNELVTYFIKKLNEISN